LVSELILSTRCFAVALQSASYSDSCNESENNDFVNFRSQCGLLFGLPWYLTWFGHSLNHYRSVVRLYDYFLASEPLMPLYVTASIVLYREEDVFREECDRASLHCLLSQLPDDLPFEYLLVQSEKLYEKYPPHDLHRDIEKIIDRE
jgi:TBC1 domain family member 20